MRKGVVFFIIAVLVVSCNLHTDDYYFKKGKKEYDLKHYKQADSLYTLAINKNNANAVAFNNRGLTEQAMGLYSEAMVDYNKALIIDPKLESAYNNIGYLDVTIGDFNEDSSKYIFAINSLNIAIGLDSLDYNAYCNRGWAKLGLNRCYDAINDFNKGISLNPNIESLYNNRGEAYSMLGKDSAAKADFIKALELNPIAPIVNDNLGSIEYKSGNYIDALKYFNKALEFDSNHRITYYHRGLTEIKLNEKDKACEDFYKADKYGYDGAQDAIDENCK